MVGHNPVLLRVCIHRHKTLLGKVRSANISWVSTSCLHCVISSGVQFVSLGSSSSRKLRLTLRYNIRKYVVKSEILFQFSLPQLAGFVDIHLIFSLVRLCKWARHKNYILLSTYSGPGTSPYILSFNYYNNPME